MSQAQDTYVPGSPASSGATFTDLKNKGVSGLLAALITANAQVTAPASQATASATGGGSTGGALAAGDYYIAYTYSDGYGETGAGSSESAKLTVASGNKPRVTFNDTPPTGAVFRNVYLTAAGGAAGTETLHATGVAVATTTFDLLYASAAGGTLVSLPTTNTTGAANLQDLLDSLLNKAQCWRSIERLRDLVQNFVSGKPVDWYVTRAELQKLDNLFASYRQVAADVNTLVTANPGSLSWSSGNVMPAQKRSWS